MCNICVLKGWQQWYVDKIVNPKFHHSKYLAQGHMIHENMTIIQLRQDEGTKKSWEKSMIEMTEVA